MFKLFKKKEIDINVYAPITGECISLDKVNDAVFASRMMGDGLAFKTDEDTIYAPTELYAQFNRFVQLTGKLPTHINSHHGIEMIPGVADIQLALANQYHLPIRRFFTLPKGNHPNCEYVIPKLCAIFKNDFSIPIYPNEIIDFFNEEMLKSDDIYEVAAHPGYVDYELMQLSSLTNARCYDTYNFTCPLIANWINENNIKLCTYEDIPLK